MAATVGKNGGFKIGSSSVTFFDNWTLRASTDLVETPGYGDTFKKRVRALKDWSVAVGGTLDRSDTQQAALLDQMEDATEADVLAVMETLRGSSYWQGSAIVQDWEVASSVGDKVSVTFNLICNGALSYTGS